MKLLYTPKHFEVHELVDKQTHEHFRILPGGDARIALRYFRRPILEAADWIWEHYPVRGGSARGITVNDWFWGGRFQWRGLRLPHAPDYKRWSAHSFGAGLDLDPSGITPGEMRQWILDTAAAVRREGHHEHPLLGVRRMEIGTASWVHIDCLEHQAPTIWMVNP